MIVIRKYYRNGNPFNLIIEKIEMKNLEPYFKNIKMNSELILRERYVPMSYLTDEEYAEQNGCYMELAYKVKGICTDKIFAGAIYTDLPEDHKYHKNGDFIMTYSRCFDLNGAYYPVAIRNGKQIGTLGRVLFYADDPILLELRKGQVSKRWKNLSREIELMNKIGF